MTESFLLLITSLYPAMGGMAGTERGLGEMAGIGAVKQFDKKPFKTKTRFNLSGFNAWYERPLGLVKY